MKNRNKPIYKVGEKILNFTNYETKVKVKNYLNLLIQQNFIPIINNPTRISRKNTTLIDHVNTNHFLNNIMHSGIITTDI